MLVIDKIAIIRDAIINHKQITGRCNHYHREVCPHLLGKNKNNGWSMLGWQFGGSSSKALPPEGDWRCFELDDLDEMASHAGAWHRGFYSGRGEQHCVTSIDTAIDAAHSAEIRENFGGRIRSRGIRRPTLQKWPR
jgi:hypothetical protein